MGGIKYDSDKNRLELLSVIAMQGTAAVLTHGAAKYGAHNWRKGLSWSRLIGSTLRHLLAFASGDYVDEESKLPHIDHVAANIMFLQEFYRTRKDLDDNYKQSNKEEGK